jgi:hypothetical protein
MENIEIITLHRTRNFSRKVNATFEFIKQNFKSLSKAIIFIAGPSVLLSIALMGSFMGDFFSVISAEGTNPDGMENLLSSAAFWLQGFLMLVFFMVTTVMSLSVINQYVVLYDQKKTNKIDINDVWDRVRSSFWVYVGALFLFFILFMVFYFFLAIAIVGLAAISPVLFFLGMLGLYGAVIYFGVGASMTLFIMTYEKKGFFESLARSFKLIRGEWWSSFGFYIIIYFVVSSIAMIFILPIYVYMIVIIMHSVSDGNQADPFSPTLQWTILVFFGVYYMVSVFLQLLPNIAVAIQYFNLVELKESKGLISEIESIGDAPSATLNNPEEQY